MSDFNFIPQAHLDNAVLFKLFEEAQKSDDYLVVGEIANLFGFEIGYKRIDIALQNLEGLNSITRRNNSVARPSSISPSGYKLIEDALIDKDSFVHQYATLGDSWLQKQRLVPSGVPASNRVVSKSDNRDAFDAISADLETIEAEIASDNQVGAQLGDDRELIIGEISAAKELVKQPRFHLSRIAELILPALKYLSEKFSGAAIGETAKHLIKLLLELF